MLVPDTGVSSVTLSRYRHEVGTDTCAHRPYRCRKRKRKESIVRNALLIIALVAALGVPVAASAAPPPVICGTPCDGGGGGWTGCTQETVSDSSGIRWLAYYRHYLVVSYCKQNGIITSAGIVAHGCDWEGTALCSAGPAWLTGGGVGSSYATYTGHATYIGALGGVPFAGTSVVNLTILWG